MQKPVSAVEGEAFVPAMEPLPAVECGCPVPVIENQIAASESEPEPAPKPRFIENPLPLPKKHERREIDYLYDVAEDMMKFDFEIDENDDFDHI